MKTTAANGSVRQRHVDNIKGVFCVTWRVELNHPLSGISQGGLGLDYVFVRECCPLANLAVDDLPGHS